ncbi:hypothetical protein RHECNPAF_268004 [Rhizobium etli CNPAF512]|nr:hypothetical protein RHECNPAF_268004 [Rhizobium etli CNPAF512]
MTGRVPHRSVEADALEIGDQPFGGFPALRLEGGIGRNRLDAQKLEQLFQTRGKVLIRARKHLLYIRHFRLLFEIWPDDRPNQQGRRGGKSKSGLAKRPDLDQRLQDLSDGIEEHPNSIYSYLAQPN